MDWLSSYLAQKFIDRNIITDEKKEIYKTGIKLILADVINFSIILIAGIILKKFLYSCIYLLVFWTVRRFCGGFHAKTYGVCRVVTIGTYLLIFLISVMIPWKFIIYTTLFADAVTIVTMLIFSPIRHPNKALKDVEVKANKLFSLLTTLFFVLISIVLTVAGHKEGVVISLTLFAVSVLMYVGLIANYERRDENERISR